MGKEIQKKHCGLSAAICLFVFSCLFCMSGNLANAAQKEVALNKASLKIVANRTYQLELKNAKGKIRWKTSDKKVATVSSKGKVTALAPGKCVISVKNKGKYYKCVVRVFQASVDTLRQTYSVKSKANRNKIILAGSSSLDFWTGASSAFYPYKVQNMAIAGTTAHQWNLWYKKMITDYKPEAVVIYVGTNDLASGSTWRRTVKDICSFIGKIQKKLPETPIYYVSMCPCELHPGIWAAISSCNKYMKKYCRKRTNVNYIDLASHFMKNGRPRTELFLEDKLHPNDKGYRIWSKVVANAVKRG